MMVECQHTVHVVLGDGIIGDGLEEVQLVAVVKLGTRNVDKGSIRKRNAEGIDTNGGELVDGGSVEEGSITFLEHGSALAAEVLAECPLVWGAIAADLRPPDGVVSLLLLKPSAEVGAVGLEGLPVYEVATIDAITPGEVVAEPVGAHIDDGDSKRTLLVVRNSGAVLASICAEFDAKRGQELVEVVGDQPKDVADQAWGGCGVDGASYEGGSEDS
jgi:hypothetical protein